MGQDLDSALLKPGDAITFVNRDEMLEGLDRITRPVPARHEGRTTPQRERYVMLTYLGRLVREDEEIVPVPLTLAKHPEGENRPPDFVVQWPLRGEQETFELTDGSTEEYQRRLSHASAVRETLVLPVDINTPETEAAQLWADILFAAFRTKAEALIRGRYSLDHLLIYDLTGLGLLLPLERGAPLLRRAIRNWHESENSRYRFRRISILRDLALLFDIEGHGRILRRESGRFQLPVLRARDEDELEENLRKLDRFCRENSIRHLKAFGSILGDTIEDFGAASDLDLLVEFEPEARVTLLDMARMERELGELTGFKVDLRTAADLSRYFRQEVLEEAVELGASRS